MPSRGLIQHNTDQRQGEARPGNKIGVSRAAAPLKSPVLSIRADRRG